MENAVFTNIEPVKTLTVYESSIFSQHSFHIHCSHYTRSLPWILRSVYCLTIVYCLQVTWLAAMAMLELTVAALS